MYFGIDYAKIEESERQKVKDMAVVLDEKVKEVDNLQVQNKVKDIQIDNRERAIKYHSIKDKERAENKNSWVTPFVAVLSVVAGILTGWGIGRSSK